MAGRGGGGGGGGGLLRVLYCPSKLSVLVNFLYVLICYQISVLGFCFVLFLVKQLHFGAVHSVLNC